MSNRKTHFGSSSTFYFCQGVPEERILKNERRLEFDEEKFV